MRSCAKRHRLTAMALTAALSHGACQAGAEPLANVVIPSVSADSKRSITVDDVVAIRDIDSLTLSPDRHSFAIFVRQGDAATNAYRTGWFVGDVATGRLTNVGYGGELRPKPQPSGHVLGDVSGGESRWSPDGQWIAYTRHSDGEVQLWRSRIDGSVQEQITHSAGDVGQFEWVDSGAALYFTVGMPRADRQLQIARRDREGYHYDEDLLDYADLMERSFIPTTESPPTIWIVSLADRRERLAPEAEKRAFELKQKGALAGQQSAGGWVDDMPIEPREGKGGALVWLRRSGSTDPALSVVVTYPQAQSERIECKAAACIGSIRKVWWSEDGRRVLIWRGEGINDETQAFYSWSPRTGRVVAVARAGDDRLNHCEQAPRNRILCVRETVSEPPHVATVDLRSGTIRKLADVNPEFEGIRLGRVERFEWDTPKLEWNEPGGALAGLYPPRAYGHVLYPINFDPSKQYPVFIEPYIAGGFRPAGNEHAVHVYAANGFVVLRLEFPAPDARRLAAMQGSMMRQLYSAELGFPHLTMYMESTVRGLDVATGRGFIDAARVGIGGVSHGSFVPLYMLQKYDRIAAISISGPSWGPQEYYAETRRRREAAVAASGKIGYDSWMPKPEGEGRDYWRRIDISDHVATIEAPMLMHLADREAGGAQKLLRYLWDASKPYDAYIFPGETHFKWQPAHLQAIFTRNLDWFRFWLQGKEDSAPGKAEQYRRWHRLREQQQMSVTELRGPG